MENTPIDIRFWMLSWIKTGSFMEFPWYTATFTNPRTGANPGITVSFYLEDVAGFVSERGSTRHASVKLLWTSCMSWDTCPWSKNDKFERPKSGKVNNWIAVVKRQTWFNQPKWLLFWESHAVAYRDLGWNSRKVYPGVQNLDVWWPHLGIWMRKPNQTLRIPIDAESRFP